MKLRTKLTASRDGSLVDATDENLIADAACAHALIDAIDDVAGPFLLDDITSRASEIMAGWGFDSGEAGES